MLPGTPQHVLELVRAYTAFEKIVRDLTSVLDADHSSDVAKRLADVDANLVKADRVTIKAAIERLRADNPLFFEPAPLGQHLVRLMIAANPGQDLGSLRAAVDRMQSIDKRRCSFTAKKKLLAEGRIIPGPQPGDTDVAHARRPQHALSVQIGAP